MHIFIQQKTCTRMFIAALFMIVPNCKQPKYQSRKNGYLHCSYTQIGIYTAVRMDETQLLKNVDKSHKCNVDGKMLDIEKYILYDSTDISRKAGKINILC